jgi:hypothetical protein
VKRICPLLHKPVHPQRGKGLPRAGYPCFARPAVGSEPPLPSSTDWSSFEMNESRSIVRSFPAVHCVGQMMHRLGKYSYRFPSLQTFCRSSRASTNRSLADCYRAVCCQASLPLALWLSCGWMGLLSQWRTLAAALCFLRLGAQTASHTRGQSK